MDSKDAAALLPAAPRACCGLNNKQITHLAFGWLLPLAALADPLARGWAVIQLLALYVVGAGAGLFIWVWTYQMYIAWVGCYPAGTSFLAYTTTCAQEHMVPTDFDVLKHALVPFLVACAGVVCAALAYVFALVELGSSGHRARERARLRRAARAAEGPAPVPLGTLAQQAHRRAATHFNVARFLLCCGGCVTGLHLVYVRALRLFLLPHALAVAAAATLATLSATGVLAAYEGVPAAGMALLLYAVAHLVLLEHACELDAIAIVAGAPHGIDSDDLAVAAHEPLAEHAQALSQRQVAQRVVGRQHLQTARSTLAAYMQAARARGPPPAGGQADVSLQEFGTGDVSS